MSKRRPRGGNDEYETFGDIRDAGDFYDLEGMYALQFGDDSYDDDEEYPR